MGYEIGDYRFNVERFFPRSLFHRITEIRIHHPEVVRQEALSRKRRPALTGPSGKLLILTADHPGRRLTGAAGDPLVMGDRHSYLARILRVLADPRCDGIMGTPDILEELFIVQHILKGVGGPAFLDGRIMVGTMNRGGLAGAVFEMDDTFTAYTVESMEAFRLDAAKLMFRLDVDNPDSGRTITASSRAVTECSRAGLPVFVEPLPVRKTPQGYQVQKNPADLIQVIGIAAALGASSLGTWIKIPYCEDYARVARSTTCPLFMLGGESKGDPSPILHDFAAGMAVGGNVRGALIGRNVHHPGADDPLAVALAVHGIVHENWSAEQALAGLRESRDLDLDALTRHFK